MPKIKGKVKAKVRVKSPKKQKRFSSTQYGDGGFLTDGIQSTIRPKKK